MVTKYAFSFLNKEMKKEIAIAISLLLPNKKRLTFLATISPQAIEPRSAVAFPWPPAPISFLYLLCLP